MVESTARLDAVFGSLADATRRDMLRRLTRGELSVSELAEPYELSLAAVSKHLQVLEKADLIRKRRLGKQQLVHLAPATLKEADTYLHHYKRLWESRLDALEQYLNAEQSKENNRATRKKH